jgi:phosphoserine phosphatase
MINKDQVVTVVDSKPIAIEDIKSYITKTFSLEISDTTKLSDVACDFYAPSISDTQKLELRKYFFLQKLDCCIQPVETRDKKILLSDMDATIIENETLDDLVKISGVTADIDETSRLAMEGKIDIQTTLSTRVNYLKDKPKHLIDRVLKNIKFNPGSDTLVKTLNKLGFVTTLITGGFAPISTFVGNKLSFQNIVSNEFEFNGDLFSGTYKPITGKKNSKLTYMNKTIEEKRISKHEVLALGDGANDLGMLSNAGLGIGYHAHNIVVKEIENQIFFNDLTTVLYYIGIKKKDFSN